MSKDDDNNAGGERLAEAERDLQRMQEEIAPFARKRPLRRPTTAGQWQDSRGVVTRDAGTGKKQTAN